MTNRTRAVAKKKATANKTKKKNRFASIELPDRGGDTEREGKKSINWKEDPEILERLTTVADLMNMNQPSWVIAAETETSIATAKRDMARVRELWKEFANERLEGSLDTSLMQYGEVINKAWENYKDAPASMKAQYLNVILKAQERIDKVSGIADPVDIGNRGNKPFQTEDISKIREERWKQINSKVKKVANESTANANAS